IPRTRRKNRRGIGPSQKDRDIGRRRPAHQSPKPHQPQATRPGRLPLGFARKNLGTRQEPDAPAAVARCRSAKENPRTARGPRTILQEGRRAAEHRTAFIARSRAAGGLSVPTRIRSPMKELIRQRARELGFDDCRFTSAAPPETAAQFQRWIAEKKFGEMAWLERNAEKR